MMLISENNPQQQNACRAIDLFCGIGGNSLAARNAGIQVVAGFDKWELATQVYQENHPGAKIYTKALEDIRPKDIQPEIGKVDLILASPECTHHSIARGNKRRLKYSMKLAYQVTRFSKVFKPRWILIENVPQMVNWEEFGDFIGKLRGQGYHVSEQELTASDFGVPQSRKRLYILCDLEADPPEIHPPENTTQKTAGHIIHMNGAYKTTPLDNGRRAKKTLARAQTAIDAVGAETPFLMVYYGSGGTGNGGYQLLSSPLRTVTTLDRFALVKPDENGHVMRMLQVPELQAAMGFPKDYKLAYGSRRDKIHMLGNAVCPPLIEVILHSLLHKAEPEPGLVEQDR